LPSSHLVFIHLQFSFLFSYCFPTDNSTHLVTFRFHPFNFFLFFFPIAFLRIILLHSSHFDFRYYFSFFFVSHSFPTDNSSPLVTFCFYPFTFFYLLVFLVFPTEFVLPSSHLVFIHLPFFSSFFSHFFPTDFLILSSHFVFIHLQFSSSFFHCFLTDFLILSSHFDFRYLLFFLLCFPFLLFLLSVCICFPFT
jgi:hypothetical protein